MGASSSAGGSNPSSTQVGSSSLAPLSPSGHQSIIDATLKDALIKMKEREKKKMAKDVQQSIFLAMQKMLEQSPVKQSSPYRLKQDEITKPYFYAGEKNKPILAQLHSQSDPTFHLQHTMSQPLTSQPDKDSGDESSYTRYLKKKEQEKTRQKVIG